MFKQFKEIKAREDIKQEETVLEKLITLGNKFVNELNLNDMCARDFIKEINFTYDENDIVDLIRSGNYDDESSKRFFGLYTGDLLTKLTEARHAEGKTTNIVVDGIKQDLILYHAKKADYITITNCEGNFIGFSIGSYWVSVKQVIINNCKGENIGADIADEGNIERVIINNCEGDWIGRNISVDNGDIGQIIINNCKGEHLCEKDDYHTEGKIRQLIINDPAELEKQGLTGLIELVDSMTGKSYQEVQEIAKRIGEYSNV